MFLRPFVCPSKRLAHALQREAGPAAYDGILKFNSVVTLLYVCCDIDFNKKVYLCDGPSCSPAGARKKVIY